MARRGRKPAPTDAAAVSARDAVEKYLQGEGITVAELSRQAGCSAPAIWRMLERQPAAWSPTLTKLDEFLKLRNDPGSSQAALLERLAAAASTGRDSSATTARLLRMVADLLDGGGAERE